MEQQDKQQEDRIINCGTYEVGGHLYENQHVSRLLKSDIGSNDRIFVKTKSGNRYMIRWSKSADAPKIYSERDDFNTGYFLADQYTQDDSIAEIGKPFSFVAHGRVSDKEGREWNATEVVEIEIRKGIDEDVQSGKFRMRQGAFDTLKDVVKGNTREDEV